MRIVLPLLGIVNENLQKSSPIRTKHVVKITAAELAQYLQYERRGKKRTDLFRITPSSTIRIDREIQRGVDSQGFQLQQPKKIYDIAYCLLGDKQASTPRAYLSTLIWNVRSDGAFTKQKIEVEGKPPKWELQINTDEIYLTDSAHRHFGIVEAFRQYKESPEKYPRFHPSIEFLVEIYNLDRNGEKELFTELNSLQKKISAAKKRELDVGSPIGALKDAILEYDRENENLFDNNIEVASNTNDKHTLMTMSVFVGAIGEMFSNDEIEEARQDDDVKDELAAFYCDFSYELARTIIVRCDIDGTGDADIHPFANLYRTYIKTVEDSYDKNSQLYEIKLEEARNRATKFNKALRGHDIANNNAMVKALYRVGGLIRRMPNWASVIRRLQTTLVVPFEGKFFQKENRDWFSKISDSDVPIASLNVDGTINLQVQTKNINKIFHYLCGKLGLESQASVHVIYGSETKTLQSNAGLSDRWDLARSAETFRGIEFRFTGVHNARFSEEDLSLSITPSIEWKDGTKKGAKGIAPLRVYKDESFQHELYEDLTRWVAKFELRLPSATKLPVGQSFELSLDFDYRDLDGEWKKHTAKVVAFVV